MLDKWSRIVTIAGRDPSREIRLMRGSRCTTEPPEAAVAKGASTPGFGSRHPPAAHFLPHAGKISLRLVRVPDCGHCHPPAAWDQVEGFSAMSMGPPGRQ